MTVRRVGRKLVGRTVGAARFRLADLVASRDLDEPSGPGAADPVISQVVQLAGAGHPYRVVAAGPPSSAPPLLVNEDLLEVRATAPAVREVHGALYVPVLDERRLGTGLILDSLRRPVAEALLRRGVPARPAHPVDPSGVEAGSARLVGSAIYVGHLGFGHIGHVLTEGIARLWFLTSSAEGEGLPLVHHGRPGALDAPVARAVLAGLGIDRERLVSFEEPTTIERLVVPDVSMVNLAAVHRQHRALAEVAAEGLGVGTRRDLADDGPAYLSRSRLSRRSRLLAGEAELERVLARHGVRIVHPQELTIRDQMELFARHRPVIGALGSAFHLSVFAGRGGAHVYLADSGSPANPNFHLLDATGDISGTYLRCVDAVPGRRVKPDGRLRPGSARLVTSVLA